MQIEAICIIKCLDLPVVGRRIALGFSLDLQVAGRIIAREKWEDDLNTTPSFWD